MANAVLDGTDCVMLSGETANGDYPVDAVTMMSRTCCEAEAALNYDNLYQVYTPYIHVYVCVYVEVMYAHVYLLLHPAGCRMGICVLGSLGVDSWGRSPAG